MVIPTSWQSAVQTVFKRMLTIEPGLYTILQILSVTIVEKMPVSQALTDNERIISGYHDPDWLCLFDF